MIAISDHDVRIARIAEQLRRRRNGQPVSLKKRGVAHQVPKRHDLRRRDDKIDLSDLDHVLHIDVEQQTCTAEPGVTFERLLEATLPHGLAPVIVPELRSITIGGAVAGCSVESMSFRAGGFHDTCLAYDVVTASGDVLSCTPDNENADVFQMVHGSFGTLGILGKLTFRLVPAKPFVHVRYLHYASIRAYLEAIERHRADPDLDFMDGMVHAPDDFVLSLGRFCDSAPYTHRYDWMRVYYKSTMVRREDFMTTRHYYFRYDNGVTNPTPRSWLGRLLFGRFLHSTQALRLAERAPWLLPKTPDVTIDLFIPVSGAARFLGWYERAIGHYPLWVVPYRRVRDYEWLSPTYWARVTDDLFLDLAIYGAKQPPGRDLYAEIEVALDHVAGVKTLISHNRYTEDAFWRIWNRPGYDAVKARTDPQGMFRDLYEKTCRVAQGLAAR